MVKWILLTFQLLTLKAHALGVFSLNYEYANGRSSQGDSSLSSYQQSEEGRVGNYYSPDNATSTAIGNAINRANQQFNNIFSDLGNGALINSDNLSQIITQVGTNYTPEQQQLFINNILAKSSKLKDTSVIPVTPYLLDLKPVLLSPKQAQIFNSARLKTSSAISNALKACEGKSCSPTSLQVSQNVLNGLINTAINNSVNAQYLGRWGEDTLFVDKSQQEFKEVFDNLQDLDLNDAIAALQKQKDTEQKLAALASEWDIPLDTVEIEAPATPLESYANDLIELKNCLQGAKECISPEIDKVPSEYKDEYKQLESIYKTSRYVEESNIESNYKNSAFGYLNLSTDALITGDTQASKQFEDIATSIVDIGLGLIPVVSIGKDVYELFTGKNLVTGEELTSFERTLAVVGILTAGGSHYVQAASKILGKSARVSEKLIQSGEKIIVSARKLGFDKASQLDEFIKSSTGKTWAKIKATGQAAVDKGYKIFKKDAPISNELPSNGIYARVVDKKYADKIRSGELGLSRNNPGNEAFVTALDDVANISNPSDYAKKLSLYSDKAGKNLVDTSDYIVLKFKFKPEVEKSLRTPFETANNARNYGFVPGGTTADGAREWLIDSDAAQRGIIEFID